MPPVVPVGVLVYRSESDDCPFETWIDGLDRKTRAQLLSRLARVRAGNFGDWAAITNGEGIAEMREHFGPGYRIYFGRQDQTVILLLCGSDKAKQKKAIRQAVSLWQDWKSRADEQP